MTTPAATPAAFPDYEARVEAIARRVLDRDPRVQGGVGGFEAYTPAWSSSGTQPAIGNGTLSGRYTRIGNQVSVAIQLIAGGTTTFGTGTYNLTLPFVARSGQRWILASTMFDASSGNLYTGAGIINGGNGFVAMIYGSNATGPSVWTPTAPFTYANTDEMFMSGVYEASS